MEKILPRPYFHILVIDYHSVGNVLDKLLVRSEEAHVEWLHESGCARRNDGSMASHSFRAGVVEWLGIFVAGPGVEHDEDLFLIRSIHHRANTRPEGRLEKVVEIVPVHVWSLSRKDHEIGRNFKVLVERGGKFARRLGNENIHWLKEISGHRCTEIGTVGVGDRCFRADSAEDLLLVLPGQSAAGMCLFFAARLIKVEDETWRQIEPADVVVGSVDKFVCDFFNSFFFRGEVSAYSVGDGARYDSESLFDTFAPRTGSVERNDFLWVELRFGLHPPRSNRLIVDGVVL